MYTIPNIARVTLFLHILGTLSNGLSNKSQKEQAFSDVLQNITMANKILQDLIKNYKHLATVQQSEELFESDPPSHEIDQNFKSKQNVKLSERSHQKHTDSPYSGTVMIYAGDTNENEYENTKENTKEISTDMKPISNPNPNYADDDEIKNKQFGNQKVENIISSKELQNADILLNSTSSKNKANSKESSSANIQSDEVEQIIIDIPDDEKSKEEDIRDQYEVTVLPKKISKKVLKIDLSKPISNVMGEKTRFSVQHTAAKRINKNRLIGRSRTQNNGSRIKKIVYSESFSPDNIWHEIINKPVRLRKESLYNKPKSKKDRKITVLILKSNEKDKNNWSLKPKFNNISSPKLGSLKNIILRSEYGETCLKMPIKKCKKALQIVNKNICKRRFKCKSDFKSDFIQHSKDGCNNEFTYIEDNVNNKKNITEESIEKIKPLEFRELKNNNKLKQKQDQHSNKFQSKKKIHPKENFISLRNETPQDVFTRARKFKDKYERKCQKESTKKCNNACEYAIKSTCSVHICKKKQKKATKGECKNQCKKAYDDVKKKIESSSGSNSDSDSESDSDSASGSD